MLGALNAARMQLGRLDLTLAMVRALVCCSLHCKHPVPGDRAQVSGFKVGEELTTEDKGTFWKEETVKYASVRQILFSTIFSQKETCRQLAAWEIPHALTWKVLEPWSAERITIQLKSPPCVLCFLTDKEVETQAGG